MRVQHIAHRWTLMPLLIAALASCGPRKKTDIESARSDQTTPESYRSQEHRQSDLVRNPTQSAQVAAELQYETSLQRSETVAAGDNQNRTFQLASIGVGERFLSPLQLTMSTAQHFNLSSRWKAPRDCQATISHQSVCDEQRSTCQCTNKAEQDFCIPAMESLDDLYCKLGGESRQSASYLGPQFTAGDLIILWQAALDICSLSKLEESLTARHVGVGFNQQKIRIAEDLVVKFLGTTPSSDFGRVESDFIYSQILAPLDSPGEPTFLESNPRELLEKFSATCTYLVTHSRQVRY